MDIKNLFVAAEILDADVVASVGAASHFEICPGGYWGSVLTVSDIGDSDAHIHYIDIYAGVPGRPLTFMAQYAPENAAQALDAFFSLRAIGKPLFYHGTFHFSVNSKEELIQELCDAFYEDADDEDSAEGRHLILDICRGNVPLEAADFMSAEEATKHVIRTVNEDYGGDVVAYSKDTIEPFELRESED